MSHPLDDTDFWRARLRALATRLVRRYARHQDLALIDDLEAEGWVALCALGPEHPHLRARLRQALLDALARWLYGVTWDQAPRQLTCQVSLGDAAEALAVPDPGPSPEAQALALDLLAQVLRLTQPRQHQALGLLLAAGSQRLDPAVYEAQGFTVHTLHDDRVRLREASRRVRAADHD